MLSTQALILLSSKSAAYRLAYAGREQLSAVVCDFEHIIYTRIHTAATNFSARSAREATISFCISDGLTATLWKCASGKQLQLSAVLMSEPP
jgi:hypothetical protein